MKRWLSYNNKNGPFFFKGDEKKGMAINTGGAWGTWRNWWNIRRQKEGGKVKAPYPWGQPGGDKGPAVLHWYYNTAAEPGQRIYNTERGFMMEIQEIKDRYSQAILEQMTTRDKSGRGYICPICGAGEGKHGTGLKPVPKKAGYYKCFAAGCEFYGDILELVGKTYNLADKAQQIEKAGQLIGVDFTGNKIPWYNYKKTSGTAGEGNKNMIQNNDNKGAEQQAGKSEQENEQAREKMGSYISAAADALLANKQGLDYLTARGISAELITRFKIGYTPNYGDGMNTAAIIIPTGELSYTARSIENVDKSRKYRKKNLAEKAGIFGLNPAEPLPPIVFIVEGEIDALSIIEAGYPAIATGGGTSKREIVEALKREGTPPTVFLIIPDNDRKEDGSPDYLKGIKAGQDLKKALKDAGIKALLVDVLGETWPQQYKDCNEFLQGDRAGFAAFLKEIKMALEEKLLGRVSGYMQGFVSQIVGNTPPIPTQYNALDNILEGGLHPGLVILGAISSLGKTTFCLNIADTLAAAGQDVIFYSLEMSRFELISKIISRRTAIACLKNGAGMNNAKTNLGVSDFNRWAKYNQEEKDLLQKVMEEFTTGAAQNLYIMEGMQNIGTDKIRRDIQNHIFFTGRLPVVIVDYVQILKTPDIHLTDKQKTDENVVELKRISRDFNIPIIGISSFNRDNYTEPVTMRAYKESGAIEYTSDILIGLQYEGMDYMDGESEKTRAGRVRNIFKENEQAARRGHAIPIQCKVLKNRSGGRADCVFNYFPMFNLYAE